MSLALTPALQVRSRTLIRKIRELPIAGEIIIRPGQQVDRGDIVGKAELPGELHILRISESMGIEPFEVMKGLKVREGDHVEAGQLLCEHVGLFGLFRSRYTSPISGRVDLVTERTGNVGVRLPSREISIDAYIRGTVVSVNEGKSATIECTAAFVQGIFGIGGEQQGTVTVFAKPDQMLRPEHLPEDCAGKILVGGMAPSPEVMKQAAERGARGLVIGSIDDQALKAYLGYDLGIALTGDEDVSMSLLITEGFGSLGMAERVFSLLQSLEGSPAAMNGATQVRAGAVRPELIIFAEEARTTEAAPEARPGGLHVGARVRIIRVPYFGQIARVVELPHAAERIASGAETRVLRAELESGDVVTVPRANVEMLS